VPAPELFESIQEDSLDTFLDRRDTVLVTFYRKYQGQWFTLLHRLKANQAFTYIEAGTKVRFSTYHPGPFTGGSDEIGRYPFIVEVTWAVQYSDGKETYSAPSVFENLVAASDTTLGSYLRKLKKGKPSNEPEEPLESIRFRGLVESEPEEGPVAKIINRFARWSVGKKFTLEDEVLALAMRPYEAQAIPGGSVVEVLRAWPSSHEHRELPWSVTVKLLKLGTGPHLYYAKSVPKEGVGGEFIVDAVALGVRTKGAIQGLLKKRLQSDPSSPEPEEPLESTRARQKVNDLDLEMAFVRKYKGQWIRVIEGFETYDFLPPEGDRYAHFLRGERVKVLGHPEGPGSNLHKLVVIETEKGERHEVQIVDLGSYTENPFYNLFFDAQSEEDWVEPEEPMESVRFRRLALNEAFSGPRGDRWVIEDSDFATLQEMWLEHAEDFDIETFLVDRAAPVGRAKHVLVFRTESGWIRGARWMASRRAAIDAAGGDL